MMTLYAPSPEEIDHVGQRAWPADEHVEARGWWLDKVRRSPGDWDSRAFCTVPGLVWTVSSDTCMTGRPSAPANIAYDELGREFVYRQPRSEAELAGIMSADTEEVFSCYRFDGLQRWTMAALGAWQQDHSVLTGWMRHCLTTESDVLTKESDVEIVTGLTAALAYHSSDEFRDYMAAFEALVLARRGPAYVPVRW